MDYVMLLQHQMEQAKNIFIYNLYKKYVTQKGS